MNLKKEAALQAATYVKDNMIVGLGTGSTAYYLVEELGRRVNEEGLNIIGVTTSHQTLEQATSLNIPIKDIDEVDHIDLTIDGADEIDQDFQGIKGGGGALLFEKIVALHSEDYIWIVDDSKMKDYLGTFPLPIEVVPYGSGQLLNKFNEKNMNPSFRYQENGELFVTDSGNYIIDCHLKQIDNPNELANWLDHCTGVIEHGLFIDMVHTVIVGSDEGITVHNIR